MDSLHLHLSLLHCHDAVHYQCVTELNLMLHTFIKVCVCVVQELVRERWHAPRAI